MARTIGILTAGGDRRGSSAATRAVGEATQRADGTHEIGFRDGFMGLKQNHLARLEVTGKTKSVPIDRPWKQVPRHLGIAPGD